MRATHMGPSGPSSGAASRVLLLAAGALLLAGCGEQDGTPTPGQSGDAAQVSDAPKGLDFAFYLEAVEPVFLRPRGGFVGGNAACVNCHAGSVNAPLGLQPLTEENGEVFWTEAQSRQNFENAARLVNPGAPETSRLLLAPLAPIAGGEQHSGGIFWDSTDHSEYRIIAEWIATGSPEASEEPMVEPDFTFFRSCVQPVFMNPIENAMPCTECHSGQFAIPPEEGGYWTMEQSQEAYMELMNFVDPGNPEGSRFLHKPLHPDAGGDLMHNGGRRWFSADDPERQALADWVRGEAAGEQCPPALQYDYPPRP